MLEKAAIFDREYGVDQHRGNLTVTQYFAFPCLRRHIVRQDLRLEREGFEQNPLATDLVDLITRERDPYNLLRSSRPDLDCRIDKTKTSTPNVARICVDVT